MAKYKHVDMSDDDPGPGADPTLKLESVEFALNGKGLRFVTSSFRDSRLGAGAVSFIVLAGMAGCGIGAGALALWVGMGSVGCMVSAAVGAVASLLVIIVIFRTMTRDQGPAVDYMPGPKPSLKEADKKRKTGKKRKKRR
ncbi:hypothetical protein AQJ30_23915 [Streptomyces longwoodensis]|jgi:hypothetical protein|uniref:Uncharacterized protein n=1 Tax=Streptomyces longwoodensis TaxID=68231 RepID=A0A101QU08_9ACTN|nr:hypothetical protein [Streptomyces longwoodensis]KUN35736.1 hypothetical protein AQJ30_23915 [Streptomyces longwoodensis]